MSGTRRTFMFSMEISRLFCCCLYNTLNSYSLRLIAFPFRRPWLREIYNTGETIPPVNNKRAIHLLRASPSNPLCWVFSGVKWPEALHAAFFNEAIVGVDTLMSRNILTMHSYHNLPASVAMAGSQYHLPK
ncbi:hypothetical protein CEXT_577591 [Caerostris extrusa]|uniref:Secreted protein n=1 Tax=Caerostris extrusa TaxID=172846 RepID=A0AAV4Q1G6_CAEEX|nr:hypothetical protein CEXT_577591 [Caerostris extrusa]